MQERRSTITLQLKCRSPYHMISIGNFTTCLIFTCTTAGKQREMGKEVIDAGVAFDASVGVAVDTENRN